MEPCKYYTRSSCSIIDINLLNYFSEWTPDQQSGHILYFVYVCLISALCSSVLQRVGVGDLGEIKGTLQLISCCSWRYSTSQPPYLIRSILAQQWDTFPRSLGIDNWALATNWKYTQSFPVHQGTILMCMCLFFSSIAQTQSVRRTF